MVAPRLFLCIITFLTNWSLHTMHVHYSECSRFKLQITLCVREIKERICTGRLISIPQICEFCVCWSVVTVVTLYMYHISCVRLYYMFRVKLWVTRTLYKKYIHIVFASSVPLFQCKLLLCNNVFSYLYICILSDLMSLDP